MTETVSSEVDVSEVHRRVMDLLSMKHDGSLVASFPEVKPLLTIGGFMVVKAPPPIYIQRIRVSPSFPYCSEEVRQSMNQWLDEMFGGEWVGQQPGTAYVMQNINTVILHSHDYTRLASLAGAS